MKNIEVEIRGLLTQEEYSRLNSFFSGNGTPVEEKERTLIDYSTYLPNEGVRERTKDIRVRVTNGFPEIIVKLGAWGGSESRKELSFKGKENEFETLVEIFGHLGFTKGVLCKRKTKAYEYKGIEFALVEVPDHSYYFEAEKMANTNDDLSKVEQDILAVCYELNLTILTKDEFFKYIDSLNKEANEIFEFEKFSEGYFK